MGNRNDREARTSAPAKATHIDVQIDRPKPNQLPLVVRGTWFLFVGWYLTFAWISSAMLFAISIIGLPIATWMFERTNAVMTLQQR